MAETNQDALLACPTAVQAKAVMDALWPVLGGNHTDADLWNDITLAVSDALSRTPSDAFNRPGDPSEEVWNEWTSDAVETRAPVGRPITHADLADALGCFWNASITAAHNAQDGTAFAVMGCMVEGVAAIQARLQEQAAPPATAINAELLAARVEGVRLGLEAASKALFLQRRHLAAWACETIQDLDPDTIARAKGDV